MSINTPHRRALFAGAAALAVTAAVASRKAALAFEKTGPWAIELFTSQGCSSCPPADRRLGLLMRRPDVVALSFHVDYWDYIGWKDPFATKAITERQRTYARVLNQRYVYTPEMVVDGIGHDPGIAVEPIDTLLARAAHLSPKRATPEFTQRSDGALDVRLAPFTLDSGTADVILAIYDRHRSTSVHAGENDGRTVENFNVVRRFERIARWDGSEAHWQVTADRFTSEQGLAVLVQGPDQGPMIGCNKHEPVAVD
jgi:hypothetical protein